MCGSMSHDLWNPEAGCLDRWPAHMVPGAARPGLTEAERAKLAQFQRRPFALNKRERDQLVKLQRRV
jgi:hypothetical protein